MDITGHIKGDDVVEIFGDTGTGKTTVALMLAKESVALKKKVLYIDTEKNLNAIPEGVVYKYVPDFNEVLALVKTLKPSDGYGVVILDSLGAPAVGNFASMSMQQRGMALLAVTDILYTLKVYANNAKCNIFVTNQPESVFNKVPGYVLQPWGDKSNYFAKEIWASKMISSTPMMTLIQVEAFRSRNNGRGFPLFKLQISKEGTKII